MNSTCSACELDLEREPGFYLGSIYVNYGLTVALVGPTFAILTLGLGYPRNVIAWPCGAFTILFPLWFFRYARAIWLSLGWVSTSRQSQSDEGPGRGGAGEDSIAEQQAEFQSDDAMAAIIIGGALVAIFLVMIVLMVTVGLWTATRAQ